MMPVLAGIDPGSRYLGFTEVLAGVLPAVPVRSRTLDVDPEDAGAVVSEVIALIDPAVVQGVAIEHGAPYLERPKPGMGEAEIRALHAKNQARVTANNISKEIHTRLVVALDAIGVPHLTLPQQTWAHILVPHHMGNVKQVDTNIALRERCDVELWTTLTDQHQRDAFGVVVGGFLVERSRDLGGAYAAREKARKRNAYRRKHGIPLDAPLLGSLSDGSRPWEKR